MFQPVAQSPRTGISKNQALPYPVSGSQPVGLDQIDRSASFSQGKVSESLNRNAGGGTNPGVQTLGRNFSWTDNLKANANTQHSIGRPSGFDDRKGSFFFTLFSSDKSVILEDMIEFKSPAFKISFISPFANY